MLTRKRVVRIVWFIALLLLVLIEVVLGLAALSVGWSSDLIFECTLVAFATQLPGAAVRNSGHETFDATDRPDALLELSYLGRDILDEDSTLATADPGRLSYAYSHGRGIYRH